MPKFCSKCGNPLIENDKFCRKCGAPVRQAAPQAAKAAPAAPVEAPKPKIESTEGTVMLEGLAGASQIKLPIAKGEIVLSLDEMLRGCSKVVDFGTGKRFEIIVPEGITPGDTLLVDGTGIIDQESGMEYKIELSTVIK